MLTCLNWPVVATEEIVGSTNMYSVHRTTVTEGNPSDVSDKDRLSTSFGHQSFIASCLYDRKLHIIPGKGLCIMDRVGPDDKEIIEATLT